MNLSTKILNKILETKMHKYIKTITHQDKMWSIPGVQIF